jgi:dTDP-4-dehydrorhamnose reductase
MLQLGRERDELQVVNDQWGSPTFASNIVHNSMALLKADKAGTYHLTSQGVISWYNFAKKIFALSDIDISISAVDSDAFPTKANRPYFSKLNTRKIESVAGTRIIDWKEGLKNLLANL